MIRKSALDYKSKPYGIYDEQFRFQDRISNAIKVCEKAVDDDYIDRIQEKGRQNTSSYLSLHDIDVYIATSMRSPSHFTTT